MRRSKVVVLCPSGVVTGGPEALHQLVDSLNRQGREAAMFYQPYAPVVAEAYQEYDVPVIDGSDIHSDDLVIIPEIWSDRVRDFQNVGLWWLSVDWAKRDALTCNPRVHLAQSFYAANHLTRHGQKPVMLTDYVNKAFANYKDKRKPVIAVNPAKGKSLIETFKKVAPDLAVLELKGYGREELVNVLNHTMVYIDFGHHPGRDRLPREAAVCGNVVFINNVGAGRVQLDYPVDPHYRFEWDQLEQLAWDVRNVLDNYDDHFALQEPFRNEIESQKELFDYEVRGIEW